MISKLKNIKSVLIMTFLVVYDPTIKKFWGEDRGIWGDISSATLFYACYSCTRAPLDFTLSQIQQNLHVKPRTCDLKCQMDQAMKKCSLRSDMYDDVYCKIVGVKNGKIIVDKDGNLVDYGSVYPSRKN